MGKYFKIFVIIFIVGILVFLKISSDKKQKEKELIKKIITIGEKVVNYKTFSLSNTSFSDIQDFYKTNKTDDKTQILLDNCDSSHFNAFKNLQKNTFLLVLKKKRRNLFLLKVLLFLVLVFFSTMHMIYIQNLLKILIKK